MENVVQVEVRWSECDPFSIVFYPNFFVWFDHCTWKLFQAARLELPMLREKFGFAGMPLVGAESAFSRPVRAHDAVAIHSRVSHWGRTSFKVTHRVMLGAEQAAQGLETRVWTCTRPDEPAGIKAVRIPREVIDILDGPAPR
jgi:4-hydroxybenzoyl-CoA thioesterase